MTSIARMKPATEPPKSDRIWRKVNSHTHSKSLARLPVPRLVRQPSDPKTAHVILPSEMINGLRANVFFDGGTCIAIEPNDNGDYRVLSQGKFRRSVTIPSRLIHLVEVGLSSVTVDASGGMIEIDLASARPIKRQTF